MKKKRIVCVVGTRPEAIKMAPVIHALKAEPWAEVCILATAQHRDMLDQALKLFRIIPHLDLDIMQSGQSLPALTSKLVARIDDVLAAEMPDLVIAQGDTTTVFAMALCCFYRKVPFAHVEAGLRSRDRRSPFPEEMNRVFASYLADLHFSPTQGARDNLIREGVRADSIFVTGNTVIDALLEQAADSEPPASEPDRRMVLVTIHRRENFGSPLDDICDAVIELSERFPDVDFVLPVHPNPHVSMQVRRKLANKASIELLEPLGYSAFIAMLKRACFVMTDSGGVQEEAPALGKPVLVLRTETERPEAVEIGAARLVGNRRETIVAEATLLLEDASHHARMSTAGSPYGDGHAARRIAAHVRDWLFSVAAPDRTDIHDSDSPRRNDQCTSR